MLSTKFWFAVIPASISSGLKIRGRMRGASSVIILNKSKEGINRLDTKKGPFVPKFFFVYWNLL